MSAPLSRCWALIPIKKPGEGKTRLAGVLDRDGRSRLVHAMLARVLDAGRSCSAVNRLFLVGPVAADLVPGVTVLPGSIGGLNQALEAALHDLPQPHPARLVIVAADLPNIEAADFALLANLGNDAVAIAPDRHGTGTNALSLPVPAAAAFRFQFGPGSYAAHRREAQRLGLNAETMLSDGLEKDVDDPSDLADAQDCLRVALEGPEQPL